MVNVVLTLPVHSWDSYEYLQNRADGVTKEHRPSKGKVPLGKGWKEDGQMETGMGEWKDGCWMHREPTVGSGFARDGEREAVQPEQLGGATHWVPTLDLRKVPSPKGSSAEEEHTAQLPREGAPRLHLSPHKGALSLELRAQGARKLPLGSPARQWL